ncbi:MAG: DNA polymerase IV [Lachnospiraceae bacterium]|nr:DNA polymerase IV [Lachnospiraceae bacterium]
MMAEKLIFHIDVNSAFLSWEAVDRLKNPERFPEITVDLRTIPSAVGGDRSKRRGIILAKSVPAKKYGIKTGEPITDALKKCPNLVLVPSRHEIYRQYSKAFLSILERYSDTIEQCSIDECFIDMTGTEKLFGKPVEAATRIKDEIYRELGFTVNVGISTNKLLAKMASDFKKPNLVHTLFPHEIKEKMWKLPVGELFLVGRSTEKTLHTLGIHTIGELANADVNMLRASLKKQGEVIWKFANGEGVSVVEAEPADTKSYGNATTIAFDVTDEATAGMVLMSLAETVGRRLRRDDARAEVVAVNIKYNDLSKASHQCELMHATNVTDEIYETAVRLFEELWDGRPIRLLGIQTSHVNRAADGRQMTLFDNADYEKREKLDRTMDNIRERFGTDAVKRASFLTQDKIDHAAGNGKHFD